jgi:hypothetical protein
MLALFKVFVDIVLWRKGPQDLPASALLLVLTLLAHFALNLSLGGAADVMLADVKNRPTAPLLARTLLDLAFSLLWIWLLLALFRRKDRYWQSATAFLGAGIVLLPFVNVANLLVLRMDESNPLAWPAVLAFLALLIWYVLVVAHILRSSLEIRLLPAIVLTFLYGLSEYFVVLRLLGAPPAS